MPKKTMIPAGSADDPVDTTADSAVHGTKNTDPQSPPKPGNLNDEQKQALYDDYNAPGSSISGVAAKYHVETQRVEQIVDEFNAERVKNA
jgi:hypothetical protein